MRHIIFEASDKYKVALLIKATSFKEQELVKYYVNPLNALGIPTEDIIAFTLETNEANKIPANFAKEYLNTLLPALVELGITTLYVAEATYFKQLTKEAKADPHAGYVLPCKFSGYEHLNIVFGFNHQALIYNPALQSKLDLSLSTLASHMLGTYEALGGGIIHSQKYPSGVSEIRQALQMLHSHPTLAVDIEGFSLSFLSSGVATIAFAWDEHNGLAFACDFGEEGAQRKNHEVTQLLKEFFMSYRGELIFHHAPYDVKAIIYNLWMKDPLDTKGLLTGLEFMCQHLHDTKIIAYLATNSTAGNHLGLKTLAHEFAGNWAIDEIKDISKVPLNQLLQYNLVDVLSTFYVYKKYYPVMVEDSQENLYKTLMLPSLKLIIQMELTGMPMDAGVIDRVHQELEQQQASCEATIKVSPLVLAFNIEHQTREMEKANAKLKTKQHPLSKFAGEVFNPNSGPQLQKLLYEHMKLPVLDYTDTKQPATGGDTLEKLVNHTDKPEYKELLEAIIGYGKVSKILNTFIPAFENGVDKQDGAKYLHGSFNLGGTVSGRLSSSDPNMQNLPANSTYGKLIKECFRAPQGWLMAGADFNSLEDYVSALTTKDPNKLLVYSGRCVYNVAIDGINHRIYENDKITYKGRSYTGAEFANLFGANSGI